MGLSDRRLPTRAKVAKGPAGPEPIVDDIGHYEKIAKILAETDRIMREIELPLQFA